MPDDQKWVIDHADIGVSDIHSSARFYEAALRPLGMKILLCINRKLEPIQVDGAELSGVSYGIDFPAFWIDVFHPHGVRQHIAFRAHSRQQVDSFHQAALAAGGTDNGQPGWRPGLWPPGYYAAFALDPDGNNIEAVFREK